MVQTISLLSMLGGCSACDVKTGRIPVVPLCLFGIFGTIFSFLSAPKSGWSLLAGAGVGLFLLVLALLSKESIGKGDALLFAVTGVFLGGAENLALLILSSLLSATGAGVALLRGKGHRARLPFVPFVFAAYLLLLLLRAETDGGK